MSLTSGTRLGPYEILSPIGAGGMGEVYRAKDTKLNRDVAIKVLPESFALDADRLARFTREAQVLASLNHPNIAQIYGIEDNAIVMELVEGQDLSALIARGPIALPDALPVAKQIADALEAAHEQGIVHRDLKPQNIKVKADGTVKVLDFGLAKAVAPDGATASADAMNSPTMTARATQMGMIIGTAAYMSPEQARGRAVDRRADIWAFGVVLYEMLAGQRAFGGDDISITLANVLKDDVKWDALPKDLPAALPQLLRRCLDRDPKRRLRDIGEARLILEDPATAANVESRAVAAPTRPLAAWITAGVFAAAFLAALFMWAPWRSTPAMVSSLAIEAPQDGSGYDSLSISPDGRRVVISAGGKLFLRALASFETTTIAGVDFPNLRHPVFSPNGESIAFAAGNVLKRVPVTGGASTDLAVLSVTPNSLNWEGTAILAGLGPRGIVRVADTGGTPETLVAMTNGESAAAPQLLPGGDAVLFTIARGTPEADWGAASIVVQTLSSSRRDVVVNAGADARYLPTGHLIYGVGGVWFAAPFDVNARKLSGAPIAVIPGVRRLTDRGLIQAKGRLAVSANGTLAYEQGVGTISTDRRLLFTTRAGVARELGWPPGHYESPRISPDGLRLAVSTNDDKDAVVSVYDLSGASALRSLTLTGRNRVPVWSPDSRRLAFQSERADTAGIFVQRADGAGEAEQWTTAEAGTTHVPESWSMDGRYLSFSVIRGPQSELWLYSIGDRKAARFGDVTSIFPLNSVFSPDSQWLAYTVRASVLGDLYVRSVLRPADRYKISTLAVGHHHPLWGPNSKELFFFGGDKFFAIPITLGSTVSWGAQVRVPGDIPVTHTSLSPRNYDITPNGGEFVWTAQVADAAAPAQAGAFVRIVMNWFEQLKTQMAAK